MFYRTFNSCPYHHHLNCTTLHKALKTAHVFLSSTTQVPLLTPNPINPILVNSLKFHHLQITNHFLSCFAQIIFISSFWLLTDPWWSFGQGVVAGHFLISGSFRYTCPLLRHLFILLQIKQFDLSQRIQLQFFFKACMISCGQRFYAYQTRPLERNIILNDK